MGFARPQLVTDTAVPVVQRDCGCGGSCADCAEKDRLAGSSAVRLGPRDDAFEQEADRVADAVMSGGAMPLRADGEEMLQRQPEEEEEEVQLKPDELQRQPEEEEEEMIQAKAAGTGATQGSVPLAAQTVATGGVPLPAAERAFFEPRFGRDLGHVRIHADAGAATAAKGIGARAYTLRNHIAFGPGQFSPGNTEGRRLMAHELTHVFQQGGGGMVRRGCSDPDFCTPYPTRADARDAEDDINTYWMSLFEGYATYGPEVENLYERFLARTPGDSLSPITYESESSYIVRQFKDSGEIEDDMDAVIELVGSRLSRAPGWPYRTSGERIMSLTNFLSTSEMENRPINWSGVTSVPGHIAGGIGSSDAGDDYRKITRANVSIDRTELFGNTGYHTVELIPHYEIFDAIDFCPGDCGSPAEQLVTIPMSRLEASGHAYDQPFKVIFSPEPRSERFWF